MLDDQITIDSATSSIIHNIFDPTMNNNETNTQVTQNDQALDSEQYDVVYPTENYTTTVRSIEGVL